MHSSRSIRRLPAHHLLLGLLLVFTSALVVTPVRASPGDAKLAEALFTSGKDAMARGDLVTACNRFAESLKLDAAVGTLLNLAACEEKSGKLVAALEHFKQAQSQLPEGDFRVPFATERLTSVSQRVPRLVVRRAIDLAAGTRILRDGAELSPAALGAPIPVDPGHHVLTVEEPGRPPRRIEVTLAEAEEKVVEIGASPAPTITVVNAEPKAPAKSGDVQEPAPGNTRRTLAFIAAGASAAGLVTGAITGLVAIDAASTYKAHCTDGVCDEEGLGAASTGRTVSIVSPVAFGAGAAFGLASLYLFLSSNGSGPRATRVVPTVSAAGAGGLLVVGSF